MTIRPVTPQPVTQADIDRLDRAIVEIGVKGYSKVRSPDGAEITYRSVDEVMAARRAAMNAVRARQPAGIFARSTRARFCRD